MRRATYVILMLIFGVLTCTRKEAKFTGERGGSLVIGTLDLPARISPLEPSLFASNEILELLFLPLHRVDPRTGSMQPVLAESWEFSEDLRSITYYIRKNVTWWDGTAVTAEDILFTYQKMKDPATNYPNVNSLRFVSEVKVINPRAIRFICEKVYADILTDTDIRPVPKHVYEEVGLNFGRSPVGNGPYRIKEWVPDQSILLVVNEGYYRELPALDEIRIRHYTVVEDMIDDFTTGDLDLVLDITPGAAQELRSNENVSVLTRPGNTYLYVAWNLSHPFLKDGQVRKALSMAINKRRILSEIYHDMGEMSSGPLVPSSWGYDAEVMPVEYNLAGARDMLRDMDFVDFNRNRVIDKDRQDFVLTIITNSENPDRVAILDYVAEDLRQLGVRVIIRTLDASAFISALANRQFDGFIMGWHVSEKIDPAIYWSSQGKYNFVGYSNARVDSLIESGVSMLDRKRAQRVWSEFQRTVYDDQPYSFLVVPNRMAAMYKRVRGVEHEVRLTNAHVYWIPEAERRVSIATLAPDLSREQRGVGEPSSAPARIETTRTLSESAPAVVAPEQILEAAAQSDTSTADTSLSIVVSLPPAPPKPSVISRAEPTKRIEPKYPAAAAEFNAAGTIVVRVLVGEDGKVKQARVMQSFGNPACEQAALDAARQWEFTPATKDGVPFEQRVSIPFTFTP